MAATPNVAGTAIFRRNGVSYSVRGSMNVQSLSEEWTAGRNLDSTLYFTVKPVPSYVDMELQDLGDLNEQSLSTDSFDYLTIELRNGKVYGFSSAHITGGVQNNGEQGTIKCRFDGDCIVIAG
jgi:hypothetical protein